MLYLHHIVKSVYTFVCENILFMFIHFHLLDEQKLLSLKIYCNLGEKKFLFIEQQWGYLSSLLMQKVGCVNRRTWCTKVMEVNQYFSFYIFIWWGSSLQIHLQSYNIISLWFCILVIRKIKTHNIMQLCVYTNCNIKNIYFGN